MPSFSVVLPVRARRALATVLFLVVSAASVAGQPVPPSPFGEPHPVGDFAPGPADSRIDDVCAIGPPGAGAPDRLLFITGSDLRLRITDGTPNGTAVLAEGVARIVRCEASGAFFLGPERSEGDTALWWTDGTAVGTRALVDLRAAVEVSDPLADGRQLVWGRLPRPFVQGERNRAVWVTDRTPDGTEELVLPAGELGEVEPTDVAVVGERALIRVLHLSPPPGEPQTGIWTTDGTRAGTAPLVAFGTERAHIQLLPRMGGEVFFLVQPRLATGPAPLELYRSDGTPAGTVAVGADLPATLPAGGSAWVLDAPDGERLAFVLGLAVGSLDDPQRLWVTDGTADGTVELAESDRSGSAPPFSVFFDKPVRFGDRFYFTNSDAVHGNELWQTDLTPSGTAVALDLCPGPCWSSARLEAPYGERVLLTARTPETGYELWVSDLTLAGTRPVADLCPGSCSSFPYHVLQPPGAAGWTLFATRPAGLFSGRERLWRLPPPDDDRSPLDWPPRPLPVTGPPDESSSGYLFLLPIAALDRQVLFVHGTDALGVELWSLPFVDQPPPPPPGDPVESPAVPGFRLHVRISAGPAAPAVPGTPEPGCIPETACFSGALPGRTEVFVRVVGPKPNGFLWPTLVKLTTSTVEVWIERIETGELRYYVLPGARPGFDELPGLFDREGFPF